MTAKSTEPTVEELKAQLEAALAAKAQAEGDLASANEKAAQADDRAAAAEGKVVELNGKLDTAAGQLQEAGNAVAAANAKVEDLEAKAAAAPTAGAAVPGKKPFKAKEVTVVSATQYAYNIDGVRVDDVPKKLLRAPGNLLDVNMDAGLIVEFES